MQTVIVLLIVAVAVLALAWRWYWRWLAPELAAYLLKKGKVKAAMKQREWMKRFGYKGKCCD